jgi:hypothetical protein
MKTFIKLIVAGLFIFYSCIGFAGNNTRFGDDTIVVVVGNSSEIKIAIDEFTDIEQLNKEIDAVLKNVSEILESVSATVTSGDSVIKIKVEDNNIIIEEDYEIDDFWVVEEDYEEFDYEDNGYTYDQEFERYWGQYPEKSRDYKIVSYKLYFDFGFNNYLENGAFAGDKDAQYAVKPFGSWNVAFGGILRLRLARPFSLDLGYGLSWYNFKYQDKSTQVIKTDDGLEFISREVADAEFLKSKTTVPYMNISFIPTFHIKKYDDYNRNRQFRMRIGAGVYAGYRLGGKVKYSYVQDNVKNKYKDKDTNYFLTSYRYGIKAIVGFGKNIDFYATYDLSTLYAKGKGPELNPICFGLSLTF